MDDGASSKIEAVMNLFKLLCIFGSSSVANLHSVEELYYNIAQCLLVFGNHIAVVHQLNCNRLPRRLPRWI